ncbi:LOW QUALITY PROTEIN: active breakpoint cluster region-related protein [Ciona intestinalis]
MTMKEEFLAEWAKKFPGEEPPANVAFKNVEDIETSLTNCQTLIKDLEEKLSREKFHLIYLQTCLAAKRQSYKRENWGYRASSSSVDSEPTSPNPVLEKPVADNNSVDINANETKSVETTKVAPAVGPKFTKLKKEEEEKRSNRLSKVLENVKIFEARATEPKEPLPDMASSTFPPRASLRKRTSYLEVWECKTGPDKEGSETNDTPKTQFAVKQENPSEENLNDAVAMVTGPKQKASRGRGDYVEVWTCNTGNQSNVGMYDSDNQFDSMTALNEEANGKDYDISDIDMKDGYGKRHYTLASTDVKLRKSSNENQAVPNSRLTWPAAGPNYDEQEELDGDPGKQGNMDRYSPDLSDLDHSSDSQHSGSSRRDSFESVSETSTHSNQNKLNIPEVSPLHQLRDARTTNERMSVAYSAFSNWSDDDRTTPDRSSMLSVQSMEFQSSDDDLAGSDDMSLSTSNNIAGNLHAINQARREQSDSPTPIFVFSKPKGTETDGQSEDIGRTQSMSMPQKTTSVSTDTVLHGSPSKSEAVSDMVDYQKVRSIAEAEKLRMRKWVLTSLLDNEEAYLQYLNTLLLYMKPLKATIGTSQPVMSAQDFDTVFFRVNELHELHANFFQKMKPRLDVWSADTAVGDLFKKLLSKLNLYGDYLNNYKRAQHTVEKCAKENEQFRHIIESLKVQSRRSKDSESISLIEVLYKPVERFMRTTLVLQDLLKHTPHRHPDYHTLRQVLKQAQQFLERINSASSSSYKPRRVPSSAAAAARSADRELIKDGFLVEVSNDGSRKLRHCFLYNDLLLCAKQKSAAGVFHSKDSYECKWYIPLADLSFQPKEDSEAIPDVQPTSEDDLRELSNRAQQTKRDIARERKAHSKAAKEHSRSSESSPAKTRREERLRKKLAELEARIVLAAPDLPLRIYHMQGKERSKSYMFLMSSDYERIEWTEAIMKQQETCFKSFSLASLEVNALLSACVRLRKMNNVGSMYKHEDEDLLSGYLNATIHSGQGFLHACNPYCTLEVDSYGQFQTKAKTRPCRDTKLPAWEEEFELEVDGAQTLRILCYDRAREAVAGASYDDDVLIAKGKVGLVRESLRTHGEKEVSVLMNELSISVSIKFTPREHSLQRLPSKKSNGVFGVKIGVTAKRESSGIPSIVRKCVAEVERRGMGEVGIYRVSGVASEIQALKASFDTNRRDVTMLLGEVDINAVAGVLKLYFRELPEPLFTDSRYSDFVSSSSLTDPDVKLRTMKQLINDLPPPNYRTLHFIREHLVKVSQNDSNNKMNLHNLATVFGPTLLRPAEDKTPQITSSALALNALRMDVHYQMDVLLNCLELEEMVDYDTMLKQQKEDKDKQLSKSQEDLTDGKSIKKSKPPLTRSSTEGSFGSDKEEKTSSIKQQRSGKVHSGSVVPPPTPIPKEQRYHPYEEIYIPSSTAKPQMKPIVSRKPSSDMQGKPKPVPAPRKPVKVPKQSVVTDL